MSVFTILLLGLLLELPPPTISPVSMPVSVQRPVASPMTTEARDVQPFDGPMCGGWEDLWQEPEITDDERKLVELRLGQCSRGRTRGTNPFDMLDLVRLEDDLGAPSGILVAVWCIEAAMRTSAHHGGPIRGDFLDGYAGAYGPMQIHRWAEKPETCGLTEAGRDNLLASAACYWSRVLVRRSGATRCKDPWPLAEALVANQRKYGGLSCKEAKSDHWKEWESWR